MRKLTIFVFLILACCTPRQQTVQAVLNEVAQGLGPANLKTIGFSGSGSQFTHGQAIVPFSALPRFNANSFRYVADYTIPGSREELIRTQAGPPRGGGPQPIVGEAKTVEYLSGEYTWTVNPGTGRVNRQPGGQGLDVDVLDTRQVFLWLTPH